MEILSQEENDFLEKLMTNSVTKNEAAAQFNKLKNIPDKQENLKFEISIPLPKKKM